MRAHSLHVRAHPVHTRACLPYMHPAFHVCALLSCAKNGPMERITFAGLLQQQILHPAFLKLTYCRRISWVTLREVYWKVSWGHVPWTSLSLYLFRSTIAVSPASFLCLPKTLLSLHLSFFKKTGFKIFYYSNSMPSLHFEHPDFPKLFQRYKLEN